MPSASPSAPSTASITQRPSVGAFTPIDAVTAAALRRDAVVHRVADVRPGFPCRRCLRDADVGDRLVLVSYDPFEAGRVAGVLDPTASSSPYRSASPVYLHADDCSASLDRSPLPEQLRSRRLSVRAFDAAAMMLDGRVVDGADLPAALDELAALPGAARVHVHFAGAGCLAAVVDLVTVDPVTVDPVTVDPVTGGLLTGGLGG